MFNLRKANNVYFNEHPEEAGKNLTASEYIDLQQVCGVGQMIADAERYVEGGAYDTSSIAHPLSLILRGELVPDQPSTVVPCPNFEDPVNGPLEGVKFSDMTSIGQAVVRAAHSETPR